MGTLTFQAALGGSVNLLGPNTASNINFTLPSADGSSGQPLQTNGSGTLSFATLGIGGGGTGVTSFTANQIHYGSFSQSAGLTFDGTNFATTGTATAAKLIPTGSSVTGNGMYLPATNSVGISTNGTNAVYIDSSQNVGIGVTPSAWSSTYSKAIQISTQGAYIAGNTTGYSSGTYAWFGNNGYLDSAAAFRYTTSTSACQYQQVANSHQWLNAPNGTAGNAITFTPAMTLDGSGNLLVGTTTTASGISLFPSFSASGASGIDIKHPSGSASGNYYETFQYNNGVIGSITQSGTTAVLFNVTSDQRLKENIQDAESASALVDSLQVRQFDWKTDNTHQRYGFIAQELVTLAPEAVHQPSDQEEMMAVDYSKLVPMLVKAHQEQQALITSLTARIEALETK